MTVLRQIAEAMLAALNGAGKPAGVPAATLWTGIETEPADLPARMLGWTEESVERIPAIPDAPLVRRRVVFVVQDLLAGTGSDAGGLTPQQVAEAFRAWSVATLAQSRFGGLALDCVELRTNWELVQGEEPFARMSHEFEVTYATKTADAETRA